MARMGRVGDTGVVTFPRSYPVKEYETCSGAVGTRFYMQTVFGYLDYVNVRFSAIPTTSEDLVVQVNPVEGAEYAMTLLRVDPAATGSQNIFYQPQAPLLLEYGDDVQVIYPNSDGNAVYVRIVGHSTIKELEK